MTDPHARIAQLTAENARLRDALTEIANQTAWVTPDAENLKITVGSAHTFARAAIASAPAPDTPQDHPDWLWYGHGHISFGRWQSHPSQKRYKLAVIQPTEHDHPAGAVQEAKEVIEAHGKEATAAALILAIAATLMTKGKAILTNEGGDVGTQVLEYAAAVSEGSIPKVPPEEAAIIVADAIEADMATFNRVLTQIAANPDMPVRHYFAQIMRDYSAALAGETE